MSARSNLRVTLDFDLPQKGNTEKAIQAMNTPEKLVQIQNFIINVLAEDEEEFKLRRLSGNMHACFSADEACAECRAESTDWMHGHRTFDR